MIGFLRTAAPEEAIAFVGLSGSVVGGLVDIGRIVLTPLIVEHQKPAPADALAGA